MPLFLHDQNGDRINSEKVLQYDDTEEGFHTLLHLIDTIADNTSWTKIMSELKKLYPNDEQQFLSRYLWKKKEGEGRPDVIDSSFLPKKKRMTISIIPANN